MKYMFENLHKVKFGNYQLQVRIFILHNVDKLMTCRISTCQARVRHVSSVCHHNGDNWTTCELWINNNYLLLYAREKHNPQWIKKNCWLTVTHLFLWSIVLWQGSLLWRVRNTWPRLKNGQGVNIRKLNLIPRKTNIHSGSK